MKVPLLNLEAQYQQIRREVQSAVQSVFKSQHFILGEQVREFEREIAAYLGVRHAIGVANGTNALVLSLRALGIGKGDEVITSAYTFFATAEAVSILGAKPVFVDINPKTFNISPELILKKITKRTKAIIPVHLYGQAACMNEIKQIARKKKLLIVEDAAQAIGTNYKGKKAGTIGDLGCFSFFPTKNLGGAGDGGLVVTNDAKLADAVRILRVHGSAKRYYHLRIGYNSRLDELQAAVLRIKLKHLEHWNAQREENAKIYNRLIKTSKVVKPSADKWLGHVYHQYVIRAEKRDELRSFLSARQIGTEIYYPIPLHLQECYRDLKYKKGSCPESERAALETLALPIYPELTLAQQKFVAASIEEFYSE